MSTVIYFDTSALAEWYLNESHSEDVEKYIQRHGPVAISDLTVVEMRCLLARRRREKSISPMIRWRSSPPFRRTCGGGFLSAIHFLMDWRRALST